MKFLIADVDPAECLAIAVRIRELGYEVVSRVHDGKSLASQGLKHSPDFIICGVDLPKLDGISSSLQVKNVLKGLKIICTTVKDLTPYCHELYTEGINGFLYKDSSHQKLASAISTVARGNFYIDEPSGKRTIGYLTDPSPQINPSHAHPPSDPDRKDPLTLSPQQIIIVSALYNGKKRKEIQDILHIGLDGVNKAIKRLKEKCDVDSTAELIKLCSEKGVLDSKKTNNRL